MHAKYLIMDRIKEEKYVTISLLLLSEQDF